MVDQLGSFVINVRDIVHRTGRMRECDFEVALTEHWGEGMVAVREGEKVYVSVRLESVHEGIFVSGMARTEYRGECGRCIKPMRGSTQVDFHELFTYSSEEESDCVVHADHVDVLSPVRDAIILSLPFQPLCGSDCTDTSAVTGTSSGDMLIASVGSASTDESTENDGGDPRWAALRGVADSLTAEADKDT